MGGADSEFTISQGYSALCLAFGILYVPGGGKGPFSGSHHRSKGRPGRRTSWATRVKAAETRPSGSSKPLLANNQRLAGFVHQSISELTEMEQLWVHFCYRDSCQKRSDCWVKFLRKYTEQYTALHCEGLQVGTRSKIREMIAFRIGQAGGEIPASAPFESVTGPVSGQAWRKTYKDHWDRLGDDLERVDRSALYKIGVKISHYFTDGTLPDFTE